MYAIIKEKEYHKKTSINFNKENDYALNLGRKTMNKFLNQGAKFLLPENLNY